MSINHQLTIDKLRITLVNLQCFTLLDMISAWNDTGLHRLLNTSRHGGKIGKTFPKRRMGSKPPEAVYYIKLVLFVAGLTGNSLYAAVWLTRAFRRTPVCIVYTSLAASNTLYILLNFEISTVAQFFKENILGSNEASCKALFCLLGISQVRPHSVNFTDCRFFSSLFDAVGWWKIKNNVLTLI